LQSQLEPCPAAGEALSVVDPEQSQLEPCPAPGEALSVVDPEHSQLEPCPAAGEVLSVLDPEQSQLEPCPAPGEALSVLDPEQSQLEPCPAPGEALSVLDPARGRRDLPPPSAAEREQLGLPASSPLPPPPPLPAILPRPRNEQGEPLSLAQRRLWFRERLVPGTPANHVPMVMRLDGPLAPAVLERSLVEITARHEALRTTIELGPDGEPRQLVSPPSRFALPLADLSGLPPRRQLEERARLARAESRRPFDSFAPGHTGDAGHTGASVHAGHTGASVHAGHTGDSVHIGHTGASVQSGHTGDAGHAGHTGASVHAGHTGDSVHIGHTGDAVHAGHTAASGGAALWRRLLLRAGEREHDLLVTFHRVIADGESAEVLARELAALYGALLRGRPSPLPPPAVQPADVAAWERCALAPEMLAPHLSWFREHLAAAPAGLDLPADLPRPPVRTWRGVSHALALPPALCRSVRELARRRGATTYMVLLAAWVALLRRVTRQDDVVVGTVLSRRGRPEIEGLVGCFANTLPLRIERPGDPAFTDLLATVRAGALGLYAYQDLPLDHLSAALWPGPPGQPPFLDPPFQALFALHGNAGRRELAPGLNLLWREEEHGAAPFDLMLDLKECEVEGEAGIAGRLVASADLFTPATVERLARGWAALLADAVARPEAPLSTLALLGAAERHALLVEWSYAPRPPAGRELAGSVPARIAARAAASPAAIAVLPAEPGLPALTYGELVSRAHRLAGQLRARGVGPDVRVGIYAERTPETLVGMLAVLAAGGAFLPLDPAHPPERLAAILEDARVAVLLARPGLAAAVPTANGLAAPLPAGDSLAEPLPIGHGLAAALPTENGLAAHQPTGDSLAAPLPAGDATLVPFDAAEVAAGLAPSPEIPPQVPPGEAAIDPGDLAYVIYTSGSTGRPKGVLIPHRGFLGAVEALAERSGLGPQSRVLQFASASFDASVWEIWSALISGATLVLARPEDLLPGPPLLATLRRQGITNVFLTPTALAAMPEGADRGLPELHGLVVGGEAFPPDLAARWAAGRRLWNAYGPTEASICAAMARLGEDGQTPIGRPVAGHRLLVLGRHVELLPRGVPGELYLGGEGLARGYLGKPDLTARAFLPDPFSGEPGARLYRTGDLVRFRPDGQLEFLGRADRQVKVRGFRIEPGEIEAQIAEHPGVREAAVVPYEAAPRDLRLAAYVVAAGPAGPAAHELRAFLRARLPEHMVPSAFHFLPALPLSPSGKVDRRALPLPSPEGPEPVTRTGADLRGAAPRTPAEELLAGIWREVLGRAEIGVDDDFLDLGGHSLLIAQVLVRVRATFGVELPVRAAFEARTLAALARRIEEALRSLRALPASSAGVPPRPPLVRASRAEPLPLSFAQQRLWFLDRLDPGSPVYNLPVAFRLAGPLDPGALARSLHEVLRRHEALRTTFAEGPNGKPCQVVAPFHPAALPRVDLAALPPAAARAEAARQAVREARRPFDLLRGPLTRPLLLRLGEQEHHLFFFCHHVAFDGWSVGVLRRELGALYGAFAAGRPSPLSLPAFQYGDFAVWQRRWLAGEALAAQLAFWRERLAGAPAALELPADRPRPPAPSFRGATLALAFPAGLAAGLRRLALDEGSTLFMTALAAFSALLGRLTGQEDLVVGSPVANRGEAGIEDLIGFFVNTLALRADLTGDPSFRALLGRVRESALSAYAHQDLPFERLVEEIQAERDLSKSPLFQVMFALDPVQLAAALRPAGPVQPAATVQSDPALPADPVLLVEPAPPADSAAWAAPAPAAPADVGAPAPGLAWELLRIDTSTAKFDLALFLEEEAKGGLTAVLEYATDLFDAATVARLGRSYLCLLSGLLEEGAGWRVSDLPLLGAGERWQILGEWNEPRSWAAVDPQAPDGVCLHDLVCAQIERTPSAVALVAGRERLTYRDLGRRAGRLARRLAALGVGPEVRVGVCLSRSPALVATLLGILEAGGAYVPLDPSYPRERLAFMLEDADAAVLVTEPALASLLPATRARVLVLDGEGNGAPALDGGPGGDGNGAAILDGEPRGDGNGAALLNGRLDGDGNGAAPPQPVRLARALPGNLAYLIYTSGSTGRPKAVAIEHRSAVALVHWARRAFSAADFAGVLAATSICFDLSVFELFVPLAWGGKLVLAADALALAGHPAAAEVTMINTVPSAMAELLRVDAIPATVRTITLAGEALRGALVDALHHRTPARVLNLYGPSEDTTYSTCEVVPRGRPDGREPAIGRALPGSRALILDTGLRPVPPGVPGELYLGGDGLARGYLGRPELTAERFVPDPWGGQGERHSHRHGAPGARLYRTGDLARWLPDGRLEYLGRIDHQVKLRGFRIELGEIELALEGHPAVAAAVVLAPEVAPGESRLIAYLERRAEAIEGAAGRAGPAAPPGPMPPAADPTGHAGPPVGATELREHLRRQLPDYMLPAAMIWLARLPRNANGKVDRRALAAMDAAAGEAAPGGFAAPRGAIEELVAGFWAELLRRERVGRDDNFFDLGGHSLLAAQVASRLRASSGVELPLRRLFEAPTVARLAASVAEALGQGAAAPVPPIVPLSGAERAAGPPLSFAQRRFWFLQRMEPGSAAYNLPCAYRSADRSGARLEAAVLRRALAEVVRRHEALRTTFDVAAGSGAADTEGEPRQLIATAARCDLPLIDLAGLPAPAATGEAERLALAEARQPFDLAAGPLLRSLLLRCAAGEDRLLFNFHHIAADGWSLGVLANELSALYPAFAAGKPSPLPELAVQYADYAAWQRRTAGGAGDAAGDGAAAGQSGRFAPQVEYWRRRLAGSVPLALPADRPRPAVETFRGAQIGRPLPPARVAAARDLGRREGATLFMTLLAGLVTLLHRYSGQDDVCVGTPVAGRPRPELEPLIGIFVNTLVLRHDLAGAPNGRELLARVRDSALGAFTHQDVPFEQLVEALQPERSLARTPLFQVGFVVQEEAPLALAPGLVLAPLPLDTGTTKFNLTLALLDRGGEHELALEFSTDLFDRATAERLLGHYERLLEELCAHPERPVAELPLLTAPERQQLAIEWNDTSRPRLEALDALDGSGPRPRTRGSLVHERFGEHARRQPQALAVVSAGQRLTYGELEARANQLAHTLRALGVGPEVRVAVCAERGAARVAGLLAVLKAGGAYVSIDPAYPPAAIAYLLADARAAIVLAEERLLGRLPEMRPRVLPLDGPAGWAGAAAAADLSGGPPPGAETAAGTAGAASTTGFPGSPPPPDAEAAAAPASTAGLPDGPPPPAVEAAGPPAVEVHPDNLAYIIYTSGSTGMPKGVGVPHRGLLNLALWFGEVYGLAAGDRGALMASPAFDASELELWPALAAGASVAIADEETRLSAPRTQRWWAEQGVTVAFLPTPLAEVLLDEELPRDIDLRLRILSVGGDRLHRAPRPGLPFELCNLYGPSEASVAITREPVPPVAAERTAGAPPIGRPIDGARLHVLDRHGQPVPTGVPGELHVAGVGLARGYLGRPQLTAERFRPDPWGELHGEPGARMYSTGDLVRWLPDGRIDFLGRIDSQVKLRGMRVEPGEIEAVLARHPGVREAAVVVVEGGEAGRRLVGFVVLAGDGAGAAAEGAPALEHAAGEGSPVSAQVAGGGSPVSAQVAGGGSPVSAQVAGEGSPSLARAVAAASSPALGALKDYLRAELPEHMVPAALVALPALPLTGRGKVDRQALVALAPAPGGAARDGARHAAPRTPIEQQVASLMAEVLAVPRLGAGESFFDLGGHSLLAVRLLSRLRARFGVELPLRSLFERPTVAGIAATLCEALDVVPIAGLAGPDLPPLAPLSPAELARGVVLSSAQQRLWFSDQVSAGGPTLNIPFPLLLAGPLEPATLAAALAEIARRHAVLRTTFHEAWGEVRQWVASPAALPPAAGRPALPLVDLSALAAPRRQAEAQALTLAAARRPFDLASGPTWRAMLVREEERRHRLLLGFHHIVADGWSMGLLEGELASLYEAFTAGRRSPLAELPVQYADFASWQRRALDGDGPGASLAYWRRQLAGLPTLRLPTDRPRPRRPTARGGAVFRILPAGVADGLRRLAAQEEASLFIVTLAAFAAQLARYSGQQDLAIGSPVAQRGRLEVEGLIGCFVNNLVLRADLAGDPPFRALVRRLRETTFAAQAHAEVPFERLVAELEPRRDSSRSPLFQVMMALQPASEEPRGFAGLTVEPLPVHTGTSQFDLTLYLVEKGRALEAGCEFSTDLFDAPTVERMLADLAALSAAVVEEPDLRLSRLPIVAFASARDAVERPDGEPREQRTRPWEPEAARPAERESRLAERAAQLHERRSRLAPERLALLESRLRREKGSATAAATMGATATAGAPTALVAIQPRGARPPFFCVHPAGGDVLGYNRLAGHLGLDQPFYGLQSPGLVGGEVLLGSIEAMAAHYVAEVRRAAPPPYRLGGWSLGGVVAFEMARRLASDGVALLAILDSPPGLDPGQTLLRDETYDDDAWWLDAIAHYVAGLWGKDLGLTYEALRQLEGEERLRLFLARLQAVGLPGTQAGLEQLRRLLAVFKANTRALQRYTPRPYAGRVTLFRSAGGVGAEASSVAAAAERDFGWQAFTTLPVAVEEVPGDHVRCLAEPHVQTLAARLRAHLDLALAAP
jgi:amino acid adenylation domain-containing protein